MFRLGSVLAALLLVAIAVSASYAGAAAASKIPPDAKRLSSTPAGAPAFVPGEAIVRFRAGTGREGQARALETARATVEEALPLARAKLVRLRGGVSVADAVAALERNPNVLYAEPNFYYRPDARIPNDPRFGELWGLHSTADTDIDAPEAWDIRREAPR